MTSLTVLGMTVVRSWVAFPVLTFDRGPRTLTPPICLLDLAHYFGGYGYCLNIF
jgi:hypothetical protein